jgi:hypothetical protein
MFIVDFRELKLAHDCAHILEQSGFPVPCPRALGGWGETEMVVSIWYDLARVVVAA